MFGLEFCCRPWSIPLDSLLSVRGSGSESAAVVERKRILSLKINEGEEIDDEGLPSAGEEGGGSRTLMNSPTLLAGLNSCPCCPGSFSQVQPGSSSPVKAYK